LDPSSNRIGEEEDSEMLLFRTILIALIIVLSATLCLSEASKPQQYFDEAVTVDLRSKPCTLSVTLPQQISDIINSAEQGNYNLNNDVYGKINK